MFSGSHQVYLAVAQLSFLLGMDAAPSGCVSQLSNLKLRKPQSFIVGCKPTCPEFVLEVDNIFTGKQTDFPCILERVTLCFPKLLTIQTFLERYSGTKLVSASVCKKYRNVKDPWRAVSSNIFG